MVALEIIHRGRHDRFGRRRREAHMNTIRVIREYRTSFGDRDNISEDTLWTGNDITQLSQQYPPSDVWGADELGYAQYEDGCITQQVRFEQQLDDGSWTEIEDPRIRLDAGLSDYEREIDQENRRLFPGDYLEDDEDDWYDHHYDG
jgi:hypothetical protein